MPAHVPLAECPNCGAPPTGDGVRCGWCGVRLAPAAHAWNVVYHRSTRVRLVYPLLIVTGAALAGLLYLVAFDRLSETMLVRLTPAWFFCLTFGIFGYVAEKLLDRLADGRAQTVAEAYRGWRGDIFLEHPLPALILALMLFPLGSWRSRTSSSLLIACVGSAVWGILLLVFFSFVFPAL